MKEQAILQNIEHKLGIVQLNPMQQQVLEKVSPKGDFILYSPTGSGKTLAFAIPLLKALKHYDRPKLQAVVIAPSRELTMQIYEIVRSIANDCKVSCVYGGHSVQDEIQSLSVIPTILIATPGRLLDHVQRGRIDLTNTRQLVIDEFDKCLELGFEDEMKRLCRLMPNLSRRVLTSATQLSEIPLYVGFQDHKEFNYLHNNEQLKQRLKIWKVESVEKDKLNTLQQLLLNLPQGKTIVFANFREAVTRIFLHLEAQHILAGIYHGALEQIDREKAIDMFNNGSFQVLVSTDLGARGLDIEQVEHIVHYHIPTSAEAYTHRNGRTARVNKSGQIYVILHESEHTPDFMKIDDTFTLQAPPAQQQIIAAQATIFLAGGKKEKISKGDILGYFSHHGGIQGSEIGQIHVHDHYSLVAVPRNKVEAILAQLKPHKIKGQKLKLSIARPEARLTKDKAKR